MMMKKRSCQQTRPSRFYEERHQTLLLVLGAVFFFFGVSSLAPAQDQRDPPMTKDIVCVELVSKEVVGILREGMSGVLEKKSSDQGTLYLEVGNDRIRGVEDLSPRNQSSYKENPENFINSVKEVPLFEELELSTDAGEKMSLTWRDAFGWGKMSQRSFEESYLLSGEFSDLAKKLGHFTPKKTEDYYRRHYQRVLLGYSAGEIPFERVADQVWLFGYAKRLGSGRTNQQRVTVEIKTICYLEKYAKSLEIVSVILLENRDGDEESLNASLKGKLDSLMSKSKSIVRMISLQIEEKELQPNAKSLQMLNNDRVNRTVGLGKTQEEKQLLLEDYKVPEFVKEIEKIRFLNEAKE